MVRVKLQRYCNYGFQTVEDLQAVAQRVFPSCAVHAYRLLSPSCAVHAYRRLSPSCAVRAYRRLSPSCAVHAFRRLSPSCAVHAYRRLSPSCAVRAYRLLSPSCAVRAFRRLSPSCAVHAYRRLSPSRAAQSLVPVACVCLPCQLPVAKIICFIAFMSASFLIIRLTNRGKAWDIKLKGQNIPYIIRNTSLRIKMSRLTEFNKYFKIGYTFR